MARLGRREVQEIGVEALERVEGEGEATRTEKAVRRDTKASSKNNWDDGAEETSALLENRPRAMPGRKARSRRKLPSAPSSSLEEAALAGMVRNRYVGSTFGILRIPLTKS